MTTDPEVTLYWFSGTGNSLAVARALAAALGHARLEPLLQATPAEAAPASVVGVVFPVYAFGLPSAVAEALGRIPCAAESYVFTVATAGATPGAVHRQADRLLAARGIALAAGWTVLMPENYSPLRLRVALHREAGLRRQLPGRIAEIAAAVRQRVRGVRQDSAAPLAWAGAAIHRGSQGFLRRLDRRFRVLSTCTACGTCVRVCPVGNIRLEGDRPVWGGQCQGCFACMQWCPVEAIQSTGLAGNRLRYCHPEVTGEEIAAQARHETGD